MKLQAAFCAVGLITLMACQQEKKEVKDKAVLGKTELAAFLMDVYLAEARADNLPVPKDSAIKLFYPYEEKLMKKFHLTDSILKKTYDYYGNHPKEMEEVYDALIDSLTLREQRITHE